MPNYTMSDHLKIGSSKEFDQNWKTRSETNYNHWTKERPNNQIQLAFKSHWEFFKELLDGYDYESCLEVGSGRGSISSFFAENDYKCTLLDSSESILETAKKIFNKNGHNAEFIHADALEMPFDDNTFDIVISIGLLEHFENLEKPLNEQYRVLKPDGLFIGYIVPERPDNVQKYFNWINKILRFMSKLFSTDEEKRLKKVEIFRSDYGSERFMPFINKLNVKDIIVSGIYPLPMISHSPEFPFSLLPKFLEKGLTVVFEMVLSVRRIVYKRNPWLCDEDFGQSFVIIFRKS